MYQSQIPRSTGYDRRGNMTYSDPQPDETLLPTVLPKYRANEKFARQDQIISRSQLEALLAPDRGFLLQERARLDFNYKPEATSYTPIREQAPPSYNALLKALGSKF